MNWRRAARCQTSECVEAGQDGGVVVVRESAPPGSPVLAFPPVAWQRFTAHLKESP